MPPDGDEASIQRREATVEARLLAPEAKNGRYRTTGFEAKPRARLKLSLHLASATGLLPAEAGLQWADSGGTQRCGATGERGGRADHARKCLHYLEPNLSAAPVRAAGEALGHPRWTLPGPTMPRRPAGPRTGRLLCAALFAVACAAAAGAPAPVSSVRKASTGQEFAAALSDFRVKTVLINGAHARARPPALGSRCSPYGCTTIAYMLRG